MKIILGAVSLLFVSGWAHAAVVQSELSCKDFHPNESAQARFPDLKGACEKIVERDGELYALVKAYVHSVSPTGRSVYLYLPATDHTFKVAPGADARILTGGSKMKPGELVAGQEIRIYLGVSQFGEPDIEEIAFVTEDDVIIDHPALADDTIEKPGRVLTSVVRTGAIIESIDYTTRDVRLILADGSRIDIVADEQIEHLDKIKARDRVVIDYLESVAVVVAPPGSEPLVGDGALLQVAGRGTDEPEITEVETTLIQARIEGVNTTSRTVDLVFEDGSRRTIHVADDAPLEMVDVE